MVAVLDIQVTAGQQAWECTGCTCSWVQEGTPAQEQAGSPFLGRYHLQREKNGTVGVIR